MGPILSSKNDIFSGATIEEKGNCIVIILTEDILSEKVNGFVKLLNSFLKQRKSNLILDFSQIDYICSYGLGTIVNVLKQLRVQGGDMVFVGVGNWLSNLFSISKVDTLVKMYPTVEEAVKVFEGK
jgi:anti-sigma B factor antagonist